MLLFPVFYNLLWFWVSCKINEAWHGQWSKETKTKSRSSCISRFLVFYFLFLIKSKFIDFTVSLASKNRKKVKWFRNKSHFAGNLDKLINKVESSLRLSTVKVGSRYAWCVTSTALDFSTFPKRVKIPGSSLDCQEKILLFFCRWLNGQKIGGDFSFQNTMSP